MQKPKLNAPVLSEAALIEALAQERESGRTVAFANGCFDVVHVGHIRYLQDASNVADTLVVAINSDASVREIKGQGRPVMSAAERAEIISAIRGVDYVTIFPETSPERLLRVLKPEFQCKGTDYTPDSVPEAETVRSYGGHVVIVGDPKDHSTTAILDQLRKDSAR